MKFITFFLIFLNKLLRHDVNFKLLLETNFLYDIDQLCPIEMNDFKVIHSGCLKAIKFIVELSLLLIYQSRFYLFSLNCFLNNAIFLKS